jgi:hypothetical protein
MKYLRLVAIAVFAIGALTAIMATAANAAEVSALITYSGTGAFTISSGAGELETSGKAKIKCEGDNGTGQLGGKGGTTRSTTIAELTVTFTGCEALGLKCTSNGLVAGNIQTVPLVATLGRIKAGEAGILFRPKAGTAFLVPVSCEGVVEVTVTGSVIGVITPVDKQTTAFTITFSQSSPGLQTVKKFENSPVINNLIATVGGGPEQAGLVSKETLTLTSGSGILLA